MKQCDKNETSITMKHHTKNDKKTGNKIIQQDKIPNCTTKQYQLNVNTCNNTLLNGTG